MEGPKKCRLEREGGVPVASAPSTEDWTDPTQDI